MSLSRDDVEDILELLDGLDVEEFDLATERFRLGLRRTAAGGWSSSTEVLPVSRDEQASEADAPGGSGTAPGEPLPEGEVAIHAPLLGTFYRAPRPGAEPYVEVGSEVEEDTVVGIIETMKLMNSVHAGVRGRVTRILVANAEFAPKGSELMHVEPAQS